MAIDPNIYWRYANAMPQRPMSNAFATGLNAFNIGRDRQAQERELAMRQEQARITNALNQRKIDEFDRLAGQREDLQNFVMEATNPTQRFSATGPYAGGYQRPAEFTKQPLSRNALAYGMFARGGLEADQLLDATAPQDPYEGLDSGYVTFLKANELPSSPASYRAYQDNVLEQKKAGATRVSQQQTVAPEGTKDIVEPILRTLPERSNEIRGDYQAYQRLKGALDVVNKQGDKITGLSGSIRRALAPIATAVGLNTEEMTDAELLGTMLDTSAGSMRMEVVGPGPVTEYEQGILQKVSGKKMSAAEGLRNILTHHMKNKKANIDQFNKMIKAVANQPGYGVLDLIYQPIEIKEEDPRTVKRKGTLNGKTVIEYTNGDIEYAD